MVSACFFCNVAGCDDAGLSHCLNGRSAESLGLFFEQVTEKADARPETGAIEAVVRPWIDDQGDRTSRILRLAIIFRQAEAGVQSSSSPTRMSVGAIISPPDEQRG